MTRKHFKSIAAQLNSFWLELPENSPINEKFEWLVNDLVGEFQQVNPNFDPNKFRAAVYSD
jgi:hypothetical protein